MGRTSRTPPVLRNSEPRPSAFYRGKPYVGCGPKNKIIYADESTAHRARALIFWAYGFTNYVYPCRICPNWHLTSKPQRERPT